MNKEALTLAKLAKENPFRFFTVAEVGSMCDFGVNTMTALITAGAPVVARKINPSLLLKWLEVNADKVGKIREN
jgi:hypothetical protein